eukprot:TRINITY_DN934_c0_g1_i3.p2 TRINITY_DN934_c0_g1~~TRINITY_DN934_c0_g1_i3.p2  ORF type:complete len:424 (-),score=107.05 TRINITY_DN934_c0_g1_i3:105-1376(-)
MMSRSLVNVLIVLVLCGIAAFVLFGPRSGEDEAQEKQIDLLKAEVTDLRDAMEKIRRERDDLRARSNSNSNSGGGSVADCAADQSKLADTLERLRQLENKLRFSDGSSRRKGGVAAEPAGATAEDPQPQPQPPVPEVDQEGLRAAVVGGPPSKAEVLRRVRQTPECLEAVERGWRENTFTSQWSQDWFLYMNFLHRVEAGFYLDIGAHKPKEISNTWFFDKCLGWSGVCVEPDPGLAALLRERRSCKVINACVNNEHGEMALQAAGTAIGHIVKLTEKNERAKVVPCVTMREIIASHNITHINLFSLDVEDNEARVLYHFPEEREVPIDTILIENERGGPDQMPCFYANLLRFPFFNRGFAFVDFLGDDVWVKLTRPALWNPGRLVYPRKNQAFEQAIKGWYAKNALYPPAIRDKLLRYFSPE